VSEDVRGEGVIELVKHDVAREKQWSFLTWSGFTPDVFILRMCRA
jgi:hypothetical protein